jgi:hypothetical protein
MFTRDEFLKLRAPYLYKIKRRAERVQSKDDSLEGLLASFQAIAFEALTNYAYHLAEEDVRKENTNS